MIASFLKKVGLNWLIEHGRKYVSLGGTVQAWEAGDSYLIEIRDVDFQSFEAMPVVRESMKAGARVVDGGAFPHNAARLNIDFTPQSGVDPDFDEAA